MSVRIQSEALRQKIGLFRRRLCWPLWKSQKTYMERKREASQEELSQAAGWLKLRTLSRVGKETFLKSQPRGEAAIYPEGRSGGTSLSPARWSKPYLRRLFFCPGLLKTDAVLSSISREWQGPTTVGGPTRWEHHGCWPIIDVLDQGREIVGREQARRAWRANDIYRGRILIEKGAISPGTTGQGDDMRNTSKKFCSSPWSYLKVYKFAVAFCHLPQSSQRRYERCRAPCP